MVSVRRRPRFEEPKKLGDIERILRDPGSGREVAETAIDRLNRRAVADYVQLIDSIKQDVGKAERVMLSVQKGMTTDLLPVTKPGREDRRAMASLLGENQSRRGVSNAEVKNSDMIERVGP